MFEGLSPTEFNLIEVLSTPRECAELLFEDFNNLGAYGEEVKDQLRLYQHSSLSDESLVDFDLTAKIRKLNKKKIFDLRKRCGNVFYYGARKIGKSLITIVLDSVVRIVNHKSQKIVISSVDLIHLAQVIDPIKMGFEVHPFLELYKISLRGAPDYNFKFKNGCTLNSINFNIGSKDPGCFDSDTELLTNNGWKTFKTISLSDKVMSVEPNTRKAKYTKVSNILTYDFDGNIVNLNHDHGSLGITLNHRQMTNRSIDDFVSGKDLTVNDTIPSTINWVGSDCGEFFIRYKDKKLFVNSTFWLTMMAYYFSNGTLDKNDRQVTIKILDHTDKKFLEHYFALLGWNIVRTDYGRGFTKYRINNFVLSNHIEDHFGSNDNIVMAEYLSNVSVKLLKLFLSTYLRARQTTDDRKYNIDGDNILFQSVRLADHFQELFFKAGYSTVVKPIMIGNEYYQLSFSLNQTIAINEITQSAYVGTVWCVVTHPHGTVVARKNGQIFLSGNSQWYGKHVDVIYIEEASLETQDVYDKRKDAVSDFGAIYRISGMCNFTPNSPAGKVYYDPIYKKFIINLPQYVSPWWDDQEKLDKIKDYGGEDTMLYRVFVKGEVIAEGINEFDMERVGRMCFMEDQDIKRFEINKDTFNFFRSLIITERPQNIERIFICTDVGKRFTEIGIFSEFTDKNRKEDKEVYQYLYNISLFNLTHLEVAAVLRYLIASVRCNVVGIDCGDGEGRAIFDMFVLEYPKENLVEYMGSSKIAVGFDTDEQGDILFKDGEPVYREEYMSEFSVIRLKNIFYDGRMQIPMDYKFIGQFTVVMALLSKNGDRVIYQCVTQQGDHLFDMFKFFAISQWLKMDFNKTKELVESEDDWGVGAVSSRRKR